MGRKTKSSKELIDQFSYILTMNIDECEVVVCVGSILEKGAEPRIEQLQVTGELTKEFHSATKEVVHKYSRLQDDGELTLRPYSPGSKPDPHEVEFLDLAEHESVEKQVESLASLAQIPVFTLDSAFVVGLRFYAIILQCKREKPIYFFRNYTPKKELSRSRLFAAMFEGGTFNKIEEPVFLFDHGVDCVSRDGAMFIFNEHNFEKIFQFFELVLSVAEQTLQTIKSHVPIANFEELEKACAGHLQMQTKLKNIASKPYLKKVQMEDIKQVLKEFPSLRVTLVKRDGKEMLLFDPKDKWAVLRLLDDDYLGSVLTGAKYEVTGKRPF